MGSKVLFLFFALPLFFILSCSKMENRGTSFSPKADHFMQNIFKRKKIHLLWVIKNSDTMGSYQEKVKDNFKNNFIQVFNDQKYDFRIVTLSASAWEEDRQPVGGSPSGGSSSQPSGTSPQEPQEQASCVYNEPPSPSSLSSLSNYQFLPWFKEAAIKGVSHSILESDTPNLDGHFQNNVEVGTEANRRACSLLSMKMALEYEGNWGFYGRKKEQANWKWDENSFLSVIIVTDGGEGSPEKCEAEKNGQEGKRGADCYIHFLDKLTNSRFVGENYMVSVLGSAGGMLKKVVSETHGFIGSKLDAPDYEKVARQTVEMSTFWPFSTEADPETIVLKERKGIKGKGGKEEIRELRQKDGYWLYLSPGKGLRPGIHFRLKEKQIFAGFEADSLPEEGTKINIRYLPPSSSDNPL